MDRIMLWAVSQKVEDVVDDHHLFRVLDSGRGDADAAAAGSGGLEARPGEGGDRPGSVDPPDAVVLAVGDVEVALRVQRHAVRFVELGPLAGPPSPQFSVAE